MTLLLTQLSDWRSSIRLQICHAVCVCMPSAREPRFVHAAAKNPLPCCIVP